MKKIEITRRITIEFTEKELVALLTAAERYLSSPHEVLAVDEKEENLARNLVGILKGYLFGGKND